MATKQGLNEMTLFDMDTTQMVPLKEVAFDNATGGGMPVGAVVELFGDNSCGKTTLAFEAIDAFLDAFPEKNAYYYSYERSIDKFYVRNLLKGDEEKLKRFKIIEPLYLEDGMEHMLKVMENNLGSICVVDSLAAMSPKDESDKAIDKAQVGGFKAKAMAEVCRKIGSAYGTGSQTTVIFINHVNPSLGGFSFIPQKDTPGGKAVKFWASLRIELSIIGRLDKEEEIVGLGKKEKIAFGNIVRIKIEKNKFFPPYKRAVIYVILGRGLGRSYSLIDYGVQLGVIGMKNKMDYFLSGKEDKTVRGKQNFAKLIASNPKIADYLYNAISKIIEQKREEIKNPNVDSMIANQQVYAQGADIEVESTDPIGKEIAQSFRNLSEGHGVDQGDEDEPREFGSIEEIVDAASNIDSI